MDEILRPDICVIGGGSAGLSVAAGAAAFGVPVVLVERGRMGGDCLNHGCVPSKSLIAAARHAHAIRAAARFGITAGEPIVDFARVNAHITATIGAIAPHDSVERFEGLGVTVMKAEARFVSRDRIEAGGRQVAARRFVIATGSSPFIPPIDGLDTVPYLTNESLFHLSKLPAHLIVLGGGPVGMEMAQAHLRLGARVTLIARSRVLPRDDAELAAVVAGRMRAEGAVLHERTRVLAVERAAQGIRLTCETPDGTIHIDGSDLLVATGRRPTLAALDLDTAGIAHSQTGVAVGRSLRTSNPKVHAIGDAIGAPYFTHRAADHAGLVLKSILFRLPAAEKMACLPSATFTDPEIAQVGLTEAQAQKAVGKVEILRAFYNENDRARTEGRSEGLIKIVVGRRGRILGVGIAGQDAAEMIHLWSMIVANRLSLRHIRAMIAPYPTLSEIGKRAALSYYAPLAKKPVIRALIRWLRRLG